MLSLLSLPGDFLTKQFWLERSLLVKSQAPYWNINANLNKNGVTKRHFLCSSMAQEQSYDVNTHLRSEQTNFSPALLRFCIDSQHSPDWQVVEMSFLLPPALLDGGSCLGELGAAPPLEEAACSPLPAEPIVWWGHSKLTAIQTIFFFFIKVKRQQISTNILSKRPQAPAACSWRLLATTKTSNPAWSRAAASCAHGCNASHPAAPRGFLPKLSYRNCFTL